MTSANFWKYFETPTLLIRNKELNLCTAVSSEAWAKLREWAVLAG